LRPPALLSGTAWRADAAKGIEMTALVLVFCLQASPSACVEQHPIDDIDPVACAFRAEEYAANWLSNHPKWILSRWRCERNVPRQRPI
jgi:hypothetical protein